ncbi:MAG: hypothetical protein R6T91_10250 [Bacteroidales bacterium]
MMKKGIQLFAIALAIIFMAACSEDKGQGNNGEEVTAKSDSNEVWKADTIIITNITEIFEEQMTAFTDQEKMLQAMLDTTKDEQQKSQLEQQMQQMQQQKPGSADAFAQMVSQQLDQRENEISGFTYKDQVLTIEKVLRNPQGKDLHFEVSYTLETPEEPQPRMPQNMQQQQRQPQQPQ